VLPADAEITLTGADFSGLSAAFFGELERRFL
jgi:hypothetical protein